MKVRGRHRVLLGMAPGVGKTYRMLQEGHAEVAAGRDVVIGYLEPHDRPETSAQAEGLEMVPRRIVEYGSTSLPDMDRIVFWFFHHSFCTIVQYYRCLQLTNLYK